jgi:hypothetical protein
MAIVEQPPHSQLTPSSAAENTHPKSKTRDRKRRRTSSRPVDGSQVRFDFQIWLAVGIVLCMAFSVATLFLHRLSLFI